MAAPEALHLFVDESIHHGLGFIVVIVRDGVDVAVARAAEVAFSKLWLGCIH